MGEKDSWRQTLVCLCTPRGLSLIPGRYAIVNSCVMYTSDMSNTGRMCDVEVGWAQRRHCQIHLFTSKIVSKILIDFHWYKIVCSLI